MSLDAQEQRSVADKAAGFTLIEILVAMTIFFAAASSGLLAYQNALASSAKAEKVLSMLKVLPLIQQQVKREMQSSFDQPFPKQGSGRFLDMEYNWSARILEQGAPPTQLDPESGEVLIYKTRFHLAEVELQLLDGNSQRVFTYRELLWASMAEVGQDLL